MSDRKVLGQPMHHLRFERHVALGKEISVEVATGLDAVEHLDATDLDHSVAASWVQARRFSVEDDFPHGSILFTAIEPEAIQNVAHLVLSCG